MFQTKAVLVVFMIFALLAVSSGQGFSGGKETRKGYYPDGKLKSVCEYNKEGLLDGSCKFYDSAGAVFIEDTYTDNIQTSGRTLYPNGSLQRFYSYMNGQMNGPSRGYYESGKLKFELTYRNGQAVGPSTGYYESGKLKYALTYNNDGRAEGPFKQYYENGKLQFETTYKDGQSVGAWREYNENGKLK